MFLLRGAKEIYYGEGLSGLHGKLAAVWRSWSCWFDVRLLDPVRGWIFGHCADSPDPEFIVTRFWSPKWKVWFLGHPRTWTEVVAVRDSGTSSGAIR